MKRDDYLRLDLCEGCGEFVWHVRITKIPYCKHCYLKIYYMNLHPRYVRKRSLHSLHTVFLCNECNGQIMSYMAGRYAGSSDWFKKHPDSHRRGIKCPYCHAWQNKKDMKAVVVNRFTKEIVNERVRHSKGSYIS